MKFEHGNTAHLGRKKRGVSGRRRTIDLLDRMLTMDGNQDKFMQSIQKKFTEDPLKFWKTYVMPVLPSLSKNPKQEEQFSIMTDEERLQEITTLFNGVRKRVAAPPAEDEQEVGTSDWESTSDTGV